MGHHLSPFVLLQAALNMMTRTSAADYVQDKIYMNSVDTGWITDERHFNFFLCVVFCVTFTLGVVFAQQGFPYIRATNNHK